MVLFWFYDVWRMCAKHFHLIHLHVNSCVVDHIGRSRLADLLNCQSKGYVSFFSSQLENSVVFRYPLSFSEFLADTGSSFVMCDPFKERHLHRLKPISAYVT